MILVALQQADSHLGAVTLLGLQSHGALRDRASLVKKVPLPQALLDRHPAAQPF